MVVNLHEGLKCTDPDIDCVVKWILQRKESCNHHRNILTCLLQRQICSFTRLSFQVGLLDGVLIGDID